jgi:ABC-type glycerol-3-phosphate transport system permease component
MATNTRFAEIQQRRSPIFYLFVAGILMIYLFPFYWMIASSLKTQIQNNAFPPIFVFTPTLANYWNVFSDNPFALFLMNSLIVGLGSTARSCSPASRPASAIWCLGSSSSHRCT